MTKYLFKFGLATDTSNQLIIGGLQLLKDGVVINEYKATSSLRGRQQEGSWLNTGGLLPPTSVLKKSNGNNAFYEVSTFPIEMPEVRGVNGKFYQIFPHLVTLPNGNQRGDWGLHADKFSEYQGFPGDMESSSPGTLGCVGLETGAGYNALIRDMTKIREEGFKTVELLVQYS